MPDFQEIDPDATYSAREAAALVGASTEAIRDAVGSGRLPAERSGHRYRIAGRDLADWRRRCVRPERARRNRAIDNGGIDPVATYTLREASAAKGVSVGAVGAALADGRLPATRTRKRWVIQGSDLIAWTPNWRAIRPGMVSLGEAAKAVLTTPPTLRKAIRAGDLPATFALGRWQIDRADLDAWWRATHPEPDSVVVPDKLYRQAEAARLAGITRQAVASGIAWGQLAVVDTPEGKRVRGSDLIGWRRGIGSEGAG